MGASIPLLASLLLWELKSMDMVFVEALIDSLLFASELCFIACFQ